MNQQNIERTEQAERASQVEVESMARECSLQKDCSRNASTSARLVACCQGEETQYLLSRRTLSYNTDERKREGQLFLLP